MKLSIKNWIRLSVLRISPQKLIRALELCKAHDIPIEQQFLEDQALCGGDIEEFANALVIAKERNIDGTQTELAARQLILKEEGKTTLSEDLVAFADAGGKSFANIWKSNEEANLEQ